MHTLASTGRRLLITNGGVVGEVLPDALIINFLRRPSLAPRTPHLPINPSSGFMNSIKWAQTRRGRSDTLGGDSSGSVTLMVGFLQGLKAPLLLRPGETFS